MYVATPRLVSADLRYRTVVRSYFGPASTVRNALYVYSIYGYTAHVPASPRHIEHWRTHK